MRWFQPYKSWLEYTTIGGGSDHMIKLDPLEVDQPVEPLARHRGRRHAHSRSAARSWSPTKRLTREQALRLYTINNAYLHHEEKDEGHAGGRQARRPDRRSTATC